MKKKRKLIIAGNWKTNTSRLAEARSTLAVDLKAKIADVHIVALPPLSANLLAAANRLAPYRYAVDLITTLTSKISLLVQLFVMRRNVA
jgi:triosephosphate isomerase